MPKVIFNNPRIGKQQIADTITNHINQGRSSHQSNLHTQLQSLESLISGLNISDKAPVLEMLHVLEKELNHGAIDQMKKRKYLLDVKHMLQDRVGNPQTLDVINETCQAIYDEL